MNPVTHGPFSSSGHGNLVVLRTNGCTHSSRPLPAETGFQTKFAIGDLSVSTVAGTFAKIPYVKGS